jgi:peptide deformylase
MTVREIVYHDDARLRKNSRRVRRVTPALRELVSDMVETMHAANGIGLAAIQVGIPERVIVVQLPPDPEEGEENPAPGKLYVILNPKLARTSREVEEGVEGCLSVPGWVGEVERYSAVTVKGMDTGGRPIRIKAEGLLARVFQHEIDHCHGVLFLDHVEDPEKLWPVTVGEEEAAEAAQAVPERDAAPERSG